MRKTTKAERLAAHNQWLKLYGVHPSQLKNKPKYRPARTKFTIGKHLTSDSVGNGVVQEKKNYSGENDFVLGLAYNKGNLQPLTLKEVADPATGKRR